ncbi:hypothetical protein XELAEV_18022244mg [Xenopus laevis]|uniref:Uncharacterized protein n=1 Tax=Xenopus laevis TaxID=8355 RepID=A0A974D4Q6_XENLA|nr:hypothetical protein XELAEV_18022244mg [Xenopus laevis]
MQHAYKQFALCYIDGQWHISGATTLRQATHKHFSKGPGAETQTLLSPCLHAFCPLANNLKKLESLPTNTLEIEKGTKRFAAWSAVKTF